MKETRVIITDLDKTLLRNDKTISDYSIETIQKCKDKGILFGIATARSENESRKYINILTPDIIISNGGALATFKENIIYEKLIPKTTTNMIIKKCLENKDIGIITIDTSKNYYTNDKTINSNIDYSFAVYNDFYNQLDECAYKITVESNDYNSALQLSNEFNTCSFLGFTGEKWFRFAHLDALKHKAICEVAKHLCISIDEVVAFGDDYNDIEMLKYCGVGVAVKNALSQVKDVSDFICDENDNDGVAKWLNKYIKDLN